MRKASEPKLDTPHGLTQQVTQNPVISQSTVPVLGRSGWEVESSALFLAQLHVFPPFHSRRIAYHPNVYMPCSNPFISDAKQSYSVGPEIKQHIQLTKRNIQEGYLALHPASNQDQKNTAATCRPRGSFSKSPGIFWCVTVSLDGLSASW